MGSGECGVGSGEERKLSDSFFFPHSPLPTSFFSIPHFCSDRVGISPNSGKINAQLRRELERVKS
jgi:hypothetical protein